MKVPRENDLHLDPEDRQSVHGIMKRLVVTLGLLRAPISLCLFIDNSLIT